MKRDGIHVTGVATSSATVWLAEEPTAKLEDVERIDMTVDGADEFDAHLN